MKYIHLVDGEYELTEEGHRKVQELVGYEYDWLSEGEHWVIIKAWGEMMLEKQSEDWLRERIDKVREEARRRADWLRGGR